MKRRDLIKRLESAGFKVLRDEGRHTVFWKNGKPIIPVPRHREIPEKLAMEILKDAGV